MQRFLSLQLRYWPSFSLPDIYWQTLCSAFWACSFGIGHHFHCQILTFLLQRFLRLQFRYWPPFSLPDIGRPSAALPVIVNLSRTELFFISTKSDQNKEQNPKLHDL
jgi:hypothetical protein